jgi:beta-lactamase superfamily II metal-dependent hydrolase
MFRLHVIQARFGDSLVLEFGTPAQPRHILIDGGPPGSYAATVRPALDAIVGPGGTLELVVLSHIDNDHIVGLLHLFADLEDDQVSGRSPRNHVGQLWHNSFARTLDPTGEISQGLQAMMALAGISNVTMPLAADAFYGVKEGSRLRLLARKLKVATNSGFADELILVETAPKRVDFGPLVLAVVGPNRANLDALRAEWLDWLARTAEKIAADPAAAASADRSIPNLSSIVLLATCEGKTMLLTGDARHDHIVAGLDAAGLAPGGKLHVDVLKVQHHGSARNARRDFFETVTADTYVVSASGKDGNPDLATLQWIVESARDRGRPVTLVVTNETESCRALQKQFAPASYGYTLQTLPAGQHSVAITLVG